VKGIVFAAGLGTRLKPLTERIPKPLAPVGPWPLIRYAVETLKAAGITEIAINTFHLGDQLPKAIGDGSEWGVQITWSHEAPAILGTGGGLRQLRDFFGKESFAVINGDTIIDFDLREAIAEHTRTGATATMVLKDDPRVATFGAIGYDVKGRVWDFVGRVPVPAHAAPLKTALFTGVHIFSPRVFDYIAPAGEVNLGTETYPALLKAGETISSVLQKGYWSDLGTAERLLEANLDVIERTATFSRIEPLKGFIEGPPGVLMAPGTTREAGVRLTRPVLIGKGAQIGRDASIGPGVVIGKGAIVAQGARLTRSLVLDFTSVADTHHNEILAGDLAVKL
jgi:mannose-1-phosphate guanylyltransferase